MNSLKPHHYDKRPEATPGTLGPRRGRTPLIARRSKLKDFMPADSSATNGITLDFSRPGKPTDNAYVESFNATVRLECLGQHWFLDLDDGREKIEEWRTEYNEVRPHSAIGDRAPLSLIHLPRRLVEARTRLEILS